MSFGNIRKYREYVFYAAKARLRSEVANSYLNWIWWILEPLLNMVVYIIVFGWLFKVQEEYFPLFLYIGISMWNFFSKSVIGSVGLVKRNRDIITKIYIPKSVLLFKDILVNLFKMLLSFVIMVVMMLFYGVRIGPYFLYVLPVLITLFVFTFGISCFMLHLGVYYEDLEYFISVLLNIFMYFSGIFYSIERFLPGLAGRIAVTANPVAFLIQQMRSAMIYDRSVSVKWLLIWLLISAGLSLCGALLIKRNENNYVKLR